jgi:hypothetical protein
MCKVNLTDLNDLFNDMNHFISYNNLIDTKYSMAFLEHLHEARQFLLMAATAKNSEITEYEKKPIVQLENTIRFTLKENDEDVELIRLYPNGDIYLRGKLADNDIEVVDGMREFLANL